MGTLTKLIDIFLDTLKKTLVRFRKSKFGFGFIINIFKIPDFLTDKRVNIISKSRLVFAIATALIYMISGIDFIPEMIAGIFGFIDDIFVVVWSLGIANEELEKYKQLIKDDKYSNVIDNVDFKIKDDIE